MMTKYIAISGHAQNGKDTLCASLKSYFELDGKRVLVYHFADFLKFICSNWIGWDGKKDLHGRTLLQTLGTKYRDVNPNCWVDMARLFFSGIESEYDYIIVPDVRYKNEFNFLKDEKGARTIRINRTNYKSTLSEEQQKHISEVDLDEVWHDILFSNCSGLDYLDSMAGWLAIDLTNHWEELTRHRY